MSKKPDSSSRRSGAADHRERVERVGVAVRKAGAQSVITGRVIADRFGLHTTDLEVLDLILLRGEASAGQLAEATGLTSGSVTALIDRLEAAGYVERCADPADRRRVIVRVRHEAIEPIKAVYMKIQRRMFDLWSAYDAKDLDVIADFLSRGTAVQVECLKDIQRDAAALSSKKRGPIRARR